MIIEAKTPSKCTSEELLKFEKLVVEAGEVNSHGLKELIKQASLLIFIYIEQDIVAIGAIKTPRETYKNKIFRKAKVENLITKYIYEVGWIFVKKEYRGKGLSKKIIKEIFKEVDDNICFATTRIDNNAMQSVFKSFNLKKLGESYKSTNGDYFIDLFDITINRETSP